MKYLLTLILFVVVMTGCSQGIEPAAEAPTEFTVTATDIAFDVPLIEVAAGQPVKVLLDNQGVLIHDFSISEIPHSGEVVVEATDTAETADHEAEMGHDHEPDVHVATSSDATGSVTFTPTTPGEYEYYCTVAGHKEAGMKGTLVVNSDD